MKKIQMLGRRGDDFDGAMEENMNTTPPRINSVPTIPLNTSTPHQHPLLNDIQNYLSTHRKPNHCQF
jgi:hypothetical protein